MIRITIHARVGADILYPPSHHGLQPRWKQFVCSTNQKHLNQLAHFSFHCRNLPSYITIASAALLFFHASLSRLTKNKDGSEMSTGIKGHIFILESSAMFGYNILRLAACLVLDALSIVRLTKDGKERWTEISLLCVFVS